MTKKTTQLLPLSVAVLMGGESKRFGSPKAFLPYEGTSLAAYLLGRAADFSGDVFAVSRCLDQVPPDARGDFRVVSDIWVEKGPLSGLHSALLHTSCPVLFLGGVDMPFLKREVVEGLARAWEEAGRPMAVVPRVAGRWEPLCALWNRDLLANLQPGKWNSFQQLLAGNISVREISEGELRGWDPRLECLQNFNSPADWKSVSLPG